MNIEEFRSLNLTNSKDLYVLNEEQIRELCVEYPIIKEWDLESKNNNLKSVVCSNPDWVVVCEKGTVAFSTNEGEDYYYKSMSNSRGLILTLKEGRKGDNGKTIITKMLKTRAINKPSNDLYKNIFNLKEDIKMSEANSILDMLNKKKGEAASTTEAVKRDLPKAEGFQGTQSGITRGGSVRESNEDVILAFIDNARIETALTSNAILARAKVQNKDITDATSAFGKKLSQEGINHIKAQKVTKKSKSGEEATYSGDALVEALKAKKVTTKDIPGFDTKIHIEKSGALIASEVKPGAKFFALTADSTFIDAISTSGIVQVSKIEKFLSMKKVPQLSGKRSTIAVKEDVAKLLGLSLANSQTNGKVLEYVDGSYLRVVKKLKSSGTENRFEDFKAKMKDYASSYLQAVTPEGKTIEDLKTTQYAKAYDRLVDAYLAEKAGLDSDKMEEIIRLYDASCKVELIRVVDGKDSKVVFPRDLFIPIKYNRGVSLEEVAAMNGNDTAIEIMSGFFKPLSAKQSEQNPAPKFELLNSDAKSDLEASVYEGSYVSKSLKAGSVDGFLKNVIVRDLEGNNYGQENDLGIAIKDRVFPYKIVLPLVVAETKSGDETVFKKEKTYKTAINPASLGNLSLEEKQKEIDSPLVDSMYAKARQACPAIDNEFMKSLTKIDKGGTNTVDQSASIAKENKLRALLNLSNAR